MAGYAVAPYQPNWAQGGVGTATTGVMGGAPGASGSKPAGDTVDIEVRGFPQWTEDADLRYVVTAAGYKMIGMRLQWDMRQQDRSTATMTLRTKDAEAVVGQLNGFEFTPGYPLKARIKPDAPDPLPPGANPNKRRDTPVDSANSDENLASEYPVKNCVNAGRIEGWFMQPKDTCDARGWGHVQSFSFMGNLVWRLQHSQLLVGSNESYNTKDAVSFEVVQVKSGNYEAVKMALPHQEDSIEQPGEGQVTWEQYGVTIVPQSEHDANESEAKRQKTGEWDTGETWRRINQPYYEDSIGKNHPKAVKDAAENKDGRGIFFGGFHTDLHEQDLRAFAARAGKVTFVKLFKDIQTKRSRGCGKIFYDTVEQAQRAVSELSGQKLGGLIVTTEVLGDNSGKKRRGRDPPKPREEWDEIPKLLPMSYFSENDTEEQKMELCYAAFEDLLANHDPEGSGRSMIFMIRNLLTEINEILSDPDIKQQLVIRLKQCQWFYDNDQVIRWQESKKKINISKISPSNPSYRAWQEQKKKDEAMQKQSEVAALSPEVRSQAQAWAQAAQAAQVAAATQQNMAAAMQQPQMAQYGMGGMPMQQQPQYGAYPGY